MERIILLSLVAVLVVTPAIAVSIECINGNCTETDSVPPMFSILGSIFPGLVGPVEFDANRDRAPLEDVINPVEPPTNESDASGGGVFSIHIMRVFSIRDPSQQDLDQPNLGGPLQGIFDDMLADLGYLDLSGKEMTGDEVKAALVRRNAVGKPVTTLMLSNSRIHSMDAGMFAPAEGTIQTLDLSNSSVNLDALRGLTNLRVLNLSSNALSTLPWYGLMADTLEVLDLSNNKFEEVRPEISMLKNLRELYLSNNKITFVERSPLNLLPNLETLDLSMNTLERVNLGELVNLNQLNIDWNYLRLMGSDGSCVLPPQPLSLKLASNPWRCDCGLLQARDNNEILDLDQLQCANSQSYSYCDTCLREFLPPPNSPDIQKVSELTKDSIQHFDCRDLQEFYNAINRLRLEEPDKFTQDVCLFLGLVMLFILGTSLVVVKCCCKKPSNRKLWLRVQQIPHLEKIGKPQEVPYIKIDEPCIKA